MSRQTPPGIAPKILDLFACKLCEHWPDDAAALPKEGKKHPSYRCKVGGRVTQLDNSPCKEFELGVARCFYCAKTNHRLAPGICAYRHWNDEHPKCKRCPLGKAITRHMIRLGHVMQNREDVLYSLNNIAIKRRG